MQEISRSSNSRDGSSAEELDTSLSSQTSASSSKPVEMDWLLGRHIPDAQAERERTVAVTVEYKVFGSAMHVDRTITTLNRLLELHEFKDAFIHVKDEESYHYDLSPDSDNGS